MLRGVRHQLHLALASHFSWLDSLFPPGGLCRPFNPARRAPGARCRLSLPPGGVARAQIEFGGAKREKSRVRGDLVRGASVLSLSRSIKQWQGRKPVVDKTDPRLTGTTRFCRETASHRNREHCPQNPAPPPTVVPRTRSPLPWFRVRSLHPCLCVQR